MKIEIPDKFLKEIGYLKPNPQTSFVDELEFEICELADREPVSLTKSKYPLGIVISIKEDTMEIPNTLKRDQVLEYYKEMEKNTD